MAPVGYFYSGEQFAEQPAAPTAAGSQAHAQTVIHAGLAVVLAVSGSVLPQEAAASFVSEAERGFLIPTAVPTAVHAPVFTDTPVLPIAPPSLPTGADETGFQPPVPPPPGPVVPTFTDTPERVDQPSPIFVETFHVQTVVHEPTAIHLQQSGEALPVTPPSFDGAPPEVYDVFDVTDPVVVEPTPTVIFWVQEVLPGAVAPSQIEHYPDPLALTNPVAIVPVTPFVFTDQEILPGAVAPSLFEQADDHRALTDPVAITTTDPRVFTDQEVLPGAVAPTLVERADDPLPLTHPVVVTTTDTRVFTADEVLPQEPAAPLGIHDEAGPAELHMFSVAPVVDARVLGEDVTFAPEVFYVPVFPPNIVTVTRRWRIDSDRIWRTDG